MKIIFFKVCFILVLILIIFFFLERNIIKLFLFEGKFRILGFESNLDLFSVIYFVFFKLYIYSLRK